MKFFKLFLIIILFIFVSCKEEKRFYTADVVLKKWANSIKNFNYSEYKNYEAFPKSFNVFKEIYKEYYPGNLIVTNIGDLDEEDIMADANGNRFKYRKIEFEFREIKRVSKKSDYLIRGDLLLIKYISGKRKKEDWKMFNRTLVRIKK